MLVKFKRKKIINKRSFPTKFRLITKDETGGFFELEYHCPYCHHSVNKVIFFDATSLSTAEGHIFETDDICNFCNKKVAIVCHLNKT